MSDIPELPSGFEHLAEPIELTTFSDPAEARVAGISHALGRAIWEAAENSERIAELEVEITLDPKTRLLHYPAFEERARPIVEGTMPTQRGGDVSLVLTDLDDFGSINNEIGYREADAVCLLPSVDIIKAAATREGDQLATRFGGEEFALLLDGTDAAGARVVAARIKSEVNDITYGQDQASLGICLGIATARPGTTTYDILFDRANAALQDAKKTGKNRIRQAGDE